MIGNWLPLTGSLLKEKQIRGAPYSDGYSPPPLAVASQQIDPAIRSGFLLGLHERFKLSQYVGNSKKACVVLVRHISPPRPVTTGVWEVSVISTLMLHENGEHVANLDYNHQLTVAAIQPQVLPFGDSTPELLKFNYEMLNSGLIITSIKEI